MNPNYNFESETTDYWGVENRENRSIANELLNRFKVITKKEHDVFMWVCTNLNNSSFMKSEMVGAFKNRVRKEVLTKEKENQLSIKFD